MKAPFLFALTSMAIACTSAYAAQETKNPKTTLPYSFEKVFSQAMDDPNVIFYQADNAHRDEKYDDALQGMLLAAKYNHTPAIENAKFMIQNYQGAYANRAEVVSFLRYHAEDHDGVNADMFSRLYLADFYRGDRCVWFGAEMTQCEEQSTIGASDSAMELRQSYYYYEGAAKQGDLRARYTVGMMNLLGQGAPRNVAAAIYWLTPLAEAGNAKVAHLIGEIYNRGYWVAQNQKAASQWFALATESHHPTATLRLAQNLVRGVFGNDPESVRVEKALLLYKDVQTNVLSTTTEQAEAFYRAGVLLEHHAADHERSQAGAMMRAAIEIGQRHGNEFSVKALLWSGAKEEKTSLFAAIAQYEMAALQVEKFEPEMKQRYAIVWQRIANAYAKGQSNDLSKDERLFSKNMNKYHRVLSKSVRVIPDLFSFADYNAFVMPR
jgi:TPR repeat protein